MLKPKLRIEPNAQRFTTSALAQRFEAVRGHTEAFSAAFSSEDQTAQSMPDASPLKWHRAHTTWFFETFVLRRECGLAAIAPPTWQSLFNSYYESIGRPYPRAQRGLITRPSVNEVSDYRRQVDAAMQRVLELDRPDLRPLVELGLQHEQQHQELMHTDMLHLLSHHPSAPRALEGTERRTAPTATSPAWERYDGGITQVGMQGDGFAFDNEYPRHDALLHPFELSSRLVTNAEYQAFMADGGYEQPGLWMSEGWQQVREAGWVAPKYWRCDGPGTEATGDWTQFTLHGQQPVEPNAPVCHLSWYEADAYARWSGARLPTEFEWEHAAPDAPTTGNAGTATGASDFYQQVWQWTASAYSGYPGYAPPQGAIGEYNAKFMCNQFVLRGSSVATPPGHARRSYRNFFPPEARWQFTGLRLARTIQ